MSARESLYIVVESAYGTPKTSPALGTDAFYFNLPESDSFAGLMAPNTQEIPFGGGLDSPWDAVADHYTTNINWKGYVYPSLAKLLIQLACQTHEAAVTGPPAVPELPWVTTEPIGDLASASFYKSWLPRGAANPVRKRFAGCKVNQLTLSASRQDPKLTFSASLVAQKEIGNAIDSSTDPDATEFPDPACADMPLGPYLFSHSKANLSIAGAAVTSYLSLSLQINNKLDVLTFEDHFPSVAAMRGREFTLTFQRLLSTTPNYRTFYQGLTNEPVSLMFANGTNSFKLDFGADCYVTAYTQNPGLGKEFLETITVKNKIDHTSCNDLTLTFV